MKRLFIVLLGLMLLTSCSRNTSKTTVLTENDNGRTVVLKPGEVLIVRLAANPTTGYTWSVEDVDAAVLKTEGEAGYTPEPATPERVGSGGTSEWRFVAAGSGTTTLKMVYIRSWENPPTPAATFSVKVTVQP